MSVFQSHFSYFLHFLLVCFSFLSKWERILILGFQRGNKKYKISRTPAASRSLRYLPTKARENAERKSQEENVCRLRIIRGFVPSTLRLY